MQLYSAKQAQGSNLLMLLTCKCLFLNTQYKLSSQVITLEGWVEIMYYVMDAHSFYNFIYFILLIIVSTIHYCIR